MFSKKNLTSLVVGSLILTTLVFANGILPRITKNPAQTGTTAAYSTPYGAVYVK